MSNILYVSKKCPFCGDTMCKEDDDKNEVSYLCYTCGFIANFVSDFMSEDEKIGYTND